MNRMSSRIEEVARKMIHRAMDEIDIDEQIEEYLTNNLDIETMIEQAITDMIENTDDVSIDVLIEDEIDSRY